MLLPQSMVFPRGHFLPRPLLSLLPPLGPQPGIAGAPHRSGPLGLPAHSLHS